MPTTTKEENACKSCFSKNVTDFPPPGESAGQQLPVVRQSKRGQETILVANLSSGFCRDCGFIGNLRFSSQLARYTEGYEEQQSFSPRFNAFATSLATKLINRYDLHKKTIVEIGCGKGDFLVMLCDLGKNQGVGIDPTYVPGRHDDVASKNVCFIRDFYSEKYADYTGDMICSRHALEHIPDTGAFMETVRRAIGNKTDTVVFFELPDVERVLQNVRSGISTTNTAHISLSAPWRVIPQGRI